MIKFKLLEDGTVLEERELIENQELMVGRGSSSDILLEGHPGISRSHFKIIVNDGEVNIKLVSSTGKLIHQGELISNYTVQPGNNVVSVPPYDFHFEMIEDEEQVEEAALELAEEESGEPEEKAIQVTEEKKELSYSESFDVMEKTSVGASSSLGYYIKVFKEEKLLQELSIEGDSWVFGRGDKSDYVIKSKKASRKQFSILRRGETFYVKDLGSSNGTMLNKQQLPSNQEIEIKSGDYIEILNFKFIFEIKDALFTNKLKEVALIEELIAENPNEDLNEIRSNALVLSDELLKLPGAAVPVSKESLQAAKTKKIRMALMSLIIVVCGLYFYQTQSKPVDKVDVAAQEKIQIEKERVNAAVDRYNLALRFYNESQFERCILEVDEFLKYDVETEDTAGAAELKNQCEIEKERLQRQKDLELQQEKMQAMKQRVDEILEGCKKSVSDGVAAVNTCVAPAADMDPANEVIAALIDQAEAIELQKEQERLKNEKYRKRVAAGKALFKKAKDYNDYGDWKRSIKTYNKFIASSYPDPGKLKKKAARNVASIQSGIDKVLQKSLVDSKSYLSDANYKDSILAAKKGLEVNRDHKELLKTKAEAEKFLKTILRKFYQESVIEEDFGQIEEAKSKWKKILDLGVKGSDYYKKAQGKLKYYEEGV